MSRNNQADQLIVNALKRKSATPGRPPKVYSPRSQSPLNPPPPSFGIGTSSSSQTEPSHNKQSRSLTTPQGQLSTHRDLTVVRPDIMSLPNSQSLNSEIPPVSAIAVASPESGSWTELVMRTPASSLSSGHVSAPDPSPAVPKWSPSHPGEAMSIDDQIMTARQEAAGRLRIVNISSESYSVPIPSPRVLEVKAPRLDASLGHSIRRLDGFCRVPNPDLVNDDRARTTSLRPSISQNVLKLNGWIRQAYCPPTFGGDTASFLSTKGHWLRFQIGWFGVLSFGAAATATRFNQSQRPGNNNPGTK
ncbi:hypothetical protein M231_07587, partial [Tremella mesenterica]